MHARFRNRASHPARAARLHDARDGRRAGAHKVVGGRQRLHAQDQVARGGARGARAALRTRRRRQARERGRQRVRRAADLLRGQAARQLDPARVTADQEARAILRPDKVSCRLTQTHGMGSAECWPLSLCMPCRVAMLGLRALVLQVERAQMGAWKGACCSIMVVAFLVVVATTSIGANLHVWECRQEAVDVLLRRYRQVLLRSAGRLRERAGHGQGIGRCWRCRTAGVCSTCMQRPLSKTFVC
jgi:hypothetical protein